jgi:hypothetical protein
MRAGAVKDAHPLKNKVYKVSLLQGVIEKVLSK